MTRRTGLTGLPRETRYGRCHGRFDQDPRSGHHHGKERYPSNSSRGWPITPRVTGCHGFTAHASFRTRGFVEISGHWSILHGPALPPRSNRFEKAGEHTRPFKTSGYANSPCALAASEVKPYNLVFFVCGRKATQLISAIGEQIR